MQKFLELLEKIVSDSTPVDYWQCPPIRDIVLGKKTEQHVEKLDYVNLAKLKPSAMVYFFGRQGPAYYTLLIRENGKLFAWRDCDANALEYPIEDIISWKGRWDENTFSKGVLDKKSSIAMPYFKYDLASGKKRVLKPEGSDTIYIVGGLLGIFVIEPPA